MSVLLFAALVAAQPSAGPTPETEMLGINVPDEFQIGNHGRDHATELLELVQPPETVENWSKLVTSLIVFDAAKRPGGAAFYRRWRDDMKHACAGMTDTQVEGTVDGKPAIRGTLSCPLNPQRGKPENLETVLVQGDANLMMVQVAFRRQIAPADLALIKRVVGSLKVCDQRTLSSCSARKATGFLPTK